ncbi:MAG: hypothetical protein O7J95_00940, partial [Planctomycetota bacterium]|nr:hypothetical protein [Planctomycetota bacterium]
MPVRFTVPFALTAVLLCATFLLVRGQVPESGAPTQPAGSAPPPGAADRSPGGEAPPGSAGSASPGGAAPRESAPASPAESPAAESPAAEPAEPAEPPAAEPAEPAAEEVLEPSPEPPAEVSEEIPVVEIPSARFEDGNSYPVTEFQLLYETPATDELDVREILEAATAHLLLTDEGYVAPRPGFPGEPIRIVGVPDLAEHRFFKSALVSVIRAILAEFSAREQIVIVVLIDPTAIDENDRDLRPPGQTNLRLLVRAGKVVSVRSLAFGERIPQEDRKDHPAHRRIRERSPIQPDEFVWKDRLDAYIFHLNRHPGRRVDVALSRAEERGGGVVLDYLVYENKPWYAFAQASNTGTEETTEWRQRFGFVSNQFTGHDDIFNAQYVTGNFDEIHAFIGSYEAPVFGLNRLRWMVNGNWSRFDASEVGQFNDDFEGDEWSAGGQLIYNVFQYRELFVDAVAGLRWRNIEVESPGTGSTGDDDFFLPRVGFRIQRLTETNALNGLLGVEWNQADIAGTDPATLDQLGRVLPEEDFYVLNWSLAHSRFLDPWIFGDEWMDLESSNATLAHEVVFTFEGPAAALTRH